MTTALKVAGFVLWKGSSKAFPDNQSFGVGQQGKDATWIDVESALFPTLDGIAKGNNVEVEYYNDGRTNIATAITKTASSPRGGGRSGGGGYKQTPRDTKGMTRGGLLHDMAALMAAKKSMKPINAALEVLTMIDLASDLADYIVDGKTPTWAPEKVSK